MYILNQKGVAHALLLIAAVGLVAFILISSSASFKNALFAKLFPKSASQAAPATISGPIPSPTPTPPPIPKPTALLNIRVTPTATSATITWNTVVPSTSEVYYGKTASYGSYTYGSVGTSHTVNITGLSGNTLYHYNLRSFDDNDNLVGITGDRTFTTNPLFNIHVTPTATSATVTWTTLVPSTSEVYYGTTTSYGSTAFDSNSFVTSHSINLTGLSGNTLYHYRLGSYDGDDNAVGITGDLTFTTNP